MAFKIGDYVAMLNTGKIGKIYGIRLHWGRDEIEQLNVAVQNESEQMSYLTYPDNCILLSDVTPFDRVIYNIQ
jgi:hypothetical protein